MGPGGPHGLQLRWRASFGVRGGFDSLALPPVGTPIAIDFILVGALGQFRVVTSLSRSHLPSESKMTSEPNLKQRIRTGETTILVQARIYANCDFD